MIVRLTALAGTLCLALSTSAPARPGRFVQAPDTIPASLSDEAGHIIVGQCASCHSLDYITTQPRGKGTQFWRDEVAKMVNVYKAPITRTDADTLVTTLDHKFGGNR